VGASCLAAASWCKMPLSVAAHPLEGPCRRLEGKGVVIAAPRVRARVRVRLEVGLKA